MTLPGPEVWGADVSVHVGETAELTVSAKDGVLPYRFAWYKVLDADTLSEVLFEGENYAGNVYTIPNAQKSDAGVYRIVLTDKYGSSAECDVALAVLSKSPDGGGGDGGSDEGPDIHIVAPADPTIIRDLPVPLMKLPNTGDGSAPALALAPAGALGRGHSGSRFHPQEAGLNIVAERGAPCGAPFPPRAAGKDCIRGPGVLYFHGQLFPGCRAGFRGRPFMPLTGKITSGKGPPYGDTRIPRNGRPRLPAGASGRCACRAFPPTRRRSTSRGRAS